MTRFPGIFLSALLCSALAPCQNSVPATTGPSHSAPGFYTRTMRFGAHPSGQPVTGAPYSADEVEDVDQTLADGTHLTRHMLMARKYRDSMGRTRDDRPANLRPDSDNLDEPMLIHIFDPVAHVQYILDTEHKVAHRAEWPVGGNRSTGSGSEPGHSTVEASVTTTGLGWWQATGNAGTVEGGHPAAGSGAVSSARATTTPLHPTPTLTTGNSGGDDAQRPQFTHEDLGTETIEGVLVKGQRTTRTWPVGSVGNDRPLTTTNEFWHSPELRLSIVTRSDDPRTGVRTHKLINISRNEPDPALFQPPPGYTVKDETGEFTISLPFPRR